MVDLEKKLKEVLELVKECGEILINAEGFKGEEDKEDGSLVTEYDILIDKKLTEGLKKIINCPVLSEEHNEEIKNNYFVIDPIDGTHNFSRGFECYGIMVAYVENNVTQFSIIYMPILKKTYTAIKDKGAFLNNKKINVRKIGDRLIGNTNLSKPICIEYLTKMMNSKYNFEFRCIYAACVPVCYVASGIFDFSIQTGGLGIWDIIAPKLILEEAGGVCEVSKYNEIKYSIIAGNREVVDIIKKKIV